MITSEFYANYKLAPVKVSINEDGEILEIRTVPSGFKLNLSQNKIREFEGEIESLINIVIEENRIQAQEYYSHLKSKSAWGEFI